MRWLVVAAIAGCSGPTTIKPPAPEGSPGGSPFERFDVMTPKVGDAAPGFELSDSNGRRVKLADAIARGPVVLVWGSFT